MHSQPTFSLIVPTRQRTAQLRRLLDSLAATAANPGAVEVVLVVDDDDHDSVTFRYDALTVQHVVVPPGLTMGALNMAGYEASAGTYLMLLNDDVVARTPAWDRTILSCLYEYPDGIVLVHLNDLIFKDQLCIFPLVSRTFCELVGGICPREYVRYRIDDHIEDLFNLLAVLGERRVVYFPDVVFEHLNTVEHPEAGHVYRSDPVILARDAPLFEALFAERKELALRLLDHIERGAHQTKTAERRRRLEGITDSFALRVPGRQRVVAKPRPTGAELVRWVVEQWRRARACFQQRGYRGLAQALGRRLVNFAAR